MPTALSALLFDVDGTLADTEEAHRLAFNQAFADAGLEWEWSVSLYAKLLAVTGGRERIRHYIDHHQPRFARPADLVNWIALLHKAKTAAYTNAVETAGLPLRPGIKRLLSEARSAGLRLAIATTTSPANVTALLQKTLDQDSGVWFEVISAGDVVPKKKPAPDIYMHTLRELDIDPAQCLSFEDSENGVRSSLGAGVIPVVTVNDYTRDHDFSGAAVVLDHLGEPDQPFSILRGEMSGGHYVDLAALRRLHARHYGP